MIQAKDWKLHLVGTGSLKNNLDIHDGVIVSDFMQPDDLVKEMIEQDLLIARKEKLIKDI